MNSHKKSLLQQLLQATTLTVGFGTLWAVLMLWLGTSIQEVRPGRNRPPREDLVVRSDGTPLIENVPLDNLSLVTTRDRAGRVHDPVAREERLPATFIGGAQKLPPRVSLWPEWAGRIRVFVDDREPTAVWFFVHDGKLQGAGYFVGYERVSNRRIGFIGRSGFRPHPVPADERIPVRGDLSTNYSAWSSAPLSIYSGRMGAMNPGREELPPHLVYVPSGNRLQLVDLAARTVTTVFDAPAPIESVGVPTLSAYSGAHSTRDRSILMRTRENLYALNRKHEVTHVFAVPPEVDLSLNTNWYEIGNGQALIEFVHPLSTERGGVWYVAKRAVYRVAQDGAILDQFDVTLQTGTPAMSERTTDALFALVLPAPALLLATEPLAVSAPDRGQGYSASIVALLIRSWPTLLAVLALSALLSLLAWRQSRAFGLGRCEQATWAVFTLLLGLPGYVGFLLARRWPVRVPCPTCHAPGVRDRAACLECGTRYPDPSLLGIEIFA